MSRRCTVYPVKKVGTELEAKLAMAAETSPAMIRYWAARLLTEIKLSRRITEKERGHLSSRVYSSFPRVGTRYVLWPKGLDNKVLEASE